MHSINILSCIFIFLYYCMSYIIAIFNIIPGILKPKQAGNILYTYYNLYIVSTISPAIYLEPLSTAIKSFCSSGSSGLPELFHTFNTARFIFYG